MFQLKQKLKLAILAMLLISLAVLPASAQVKIGLPTGAANANSILDLSNAGGANKGLLFPQVTLSGTFLASPLTAHVAGMAVYNTAIAGSGASAVVPGIYINDGTKWVQLIASTNGAATYSAASLSCTGTLSGSYGAGGTMAGGNTKTMSITVSTPGSYSATTDVQNGVMFTESGSLSSVGSSVPVTLTASGTALTSGTFTYTVSMGGQGCTFPITYSANASSGGTAAISSTNCASATVSGTLTNGVAATSSNTVSIPVNTTTAGSYSIATTTVSGISWSGAGTLALGTGNIMLTASGTPTTSGAVSYPLNTTSGCSFSATNVTATAMSTSGGTAMVSAWNCTGTDAGTLQIGIAASGVTHTITATVSNAGTYSVTSTTNGVTYAGSGTFASTGSQVITLTASGTPTTSGSNSFSTSTTPMCSFTETVASMYNCLGATMVQTPSGSLVNNNSYAGSYTISYAAGYSGSYGSINQTVNGLTLTRVAGNYASNGGTVVYNLTGTAGAAQTATFNIPECTTATFGDAIMTGLSNSTSISNYNSAAVDTWVNVTAAEYAAVYSSVTGTGKYGATDATLTPTGGSFATLPSQFTASVATSQSQVPTANYPFAMTIVSQLASQNPAGFKLKLSTGSATGPYANYPLNASLPTTTITSTTPSQYYFVIKKPSTPTSAASFIGGYENGFQLSMVNVSVGAGTLYYGQGDLTNITTNTYSTTYYLLPLQVLSTPTKQW